MRHWLSIARFRLRCRFPRAANCFDAARLIRYLPLSFFASAFKSKLFPRQALDRCFSDLLLQIIVRQNTGFAVAGSRALHAQALLNRRCRDLDFFVLDLREVQEVLDHLNNHKEVGQDFKILHIRFEQKEGGFEGRPKIHAAFLYSFKGFHSSIRIEFLEIKETGCQPIEFRNEFLERQWDAPSNFTGLAVPAERILAGKIVAVLSKHSGERTSRYLRDCEFAFRKAGTGLQQKTIFEVDKLWALYSIPRRKLS